MSSEFRALVRDLEAVRESVARTDADCSAYVAAIPEAQRASARNLLQYLALRRHDLRRIQPQLATLGLSSLGRTESHVLNSVDTVLGALHALDGTTSDKEPNPATLTYDAGEALLKAHADALLGRAPKGRTVRIMVTMPGEASADYHMVRDLVAGGMDCMRINCAHDDADAWGRMIEHLRRATHDLKRDCRIAMDLAGPKLRTGPIEPGQAVFKVKPTRDMCGYVTKPALVALVSASQLHAVTASVDAILPIDGDLPGRLAEGDVIAFDDVRGRSRQLVVRAQDGPVVIATLERTAYFTTGTHLRFLSDAGAWTRSVVDIPPLQQPLILKQGDTLLLTPDSVAGRRAVLDEHGRVVIPARIGISLPEAFRDVRPGEAIWLDDGKIGGAVRSVEPEQITVEITHARPGGSTLASEKGINLPDTALRLAALTDKDIQDLAFVATHADMVGYSFVRHADDVHELQRRLADLHAEQVGIVLKIETRHAFNELPTLLLAAMRTGRFGVMIARGDLAVECGFERMAEVQEEILWICEAAHAPVIWATQVLETLAKTGMPSRAEVTDAAMSERAECVMLNKGPYIREAVRTLDNILHRMQGHQTKKRSMLRPLQVAHAVVPEQTTAQP